jgi:hypothetical protein
MPELWQAGDLDCPPFFVDHVADSVPSGPQAPQIRRPVRERLRRPRLTGELADRIPERRDTDGMALVIALTALTALGLFGVSSHEPFHATAGGGPWR